MIRITALILLLATSTHAQTTDGMGFLLLGADAMQLASSETVAALGYGPSTLFSNPALLGFEERSSVALSNTFWLEDAFNRSASASYRGRRWVAAAGMLQSTVGGIEARQKPGPSDGTFDVHYVAFTVGLGRALGSVSVGAHASALYERVFDRSAAGYRVGAGLAARYLDDRLRIGTVVSNIGEMQVLAIEATPLPGIWRSGVAVDLLQFSVNQARNVPLTLGLATDVHVPFNDAAYVSATTSLTASDVLVLRGGLRSGETTRRWTLGLELVQPRFRFSYALLPFDLGYGSSHSLGVSFAI
jgi:hypothetical protein